MNTPTTPSAQPQAAPEKPVALVTGGTSGIGLAVVRDLARRGHRVFLCARTAETVKETVEELRAEGLEVSGLAADVRSREAIAELVAAAVAEFGPISVLVNNAGRSGGGPTADISDELWYDVIDTNLNSVFLLTREVLKHGGLAGASYGRIINIASTVSKQGVLLGAPYSASKHAVVGFTKALGKELAPAGITVNAVCPGYVETPMAQRVRAGLRGGLGHHDRGRAGAVRGEDPAGALRDPGGGGGHGRLPDHGPRRVRHRAGAERLRRTGELLMAAERVHRTVHETEVAAPAGMVYGMIADAVQWPLYFPPNVHVERLAFDGVQERLRMWATANGQVKSWTSRRVLDAAARRIEFRQEIPAAPLSAMTGTWIVESLGADRSKLTLLHDFSVEGDRAQDVEWVERATDTNSRAELANLAQLGGRWGKLDELVMSFEDRVDVDAPPELVYAFLERAEQWPELLPHVSRLELTEPDELPGVQVMAMDTLTADGSSHTTESVRVCFPAALPHRLQADAHPGADVGPHRRVDGHRRRVRLDGHLAARRRAARGGRHPGAGPLRRPRGGPQVRPPGAGPQQHRDHDVRQAARGVGARELRLQVLSSRTPAVADRLWTKCEGRVWRCLSSKCTGRPMPWM